MLPFSSKRAVLGAAIVFAVLVLASIQHASAQRLPATVLPEHYSLTLTPDLTAATFTGIEAIDVTVKTPVSSITLNSAEVVFQSVTASAAGREQAATISLDAEKQQATF